MATACLVLRGRQPAGDRLPARDGGADHRPGQPETASATAGAGHLSRLFPPAAWRAATDPLQQTDKAGGVLGRGYGEKTGTRVRSRLDLAGIVARQQRDQPRWPTAADSAR